MGLLYQFGTDTQDTLHVKVTGDTIHLRSYGLPPLFWGYLLAILVVLTFLYTAAIPIVAKLYSFDNDPLNKGLAAVIMITMIATPLALISMFFYEKNIGKSHGSMTITHKVFFFTFKTKVFELNPTCELEVRHYLDSPNMARLNQSNKQFENKGYFELWGTDKSGELFFIDRSSQKNILDNMKGLLS